MPGLQIFQCVENTSEGGESFWVDGFRLAEIMQEKYFDCDHRGRIVTVRDTTWLREPLCVNFETGPKVFKADRVFASLKAAHENQGIILHRFTPMLPTG